MIKRMGKVSWTGRKMKKVAVGLLLLPIGVLTLFTVGEIMGGDWSGASHLVQLAPLVLLAWVGWRYPKIGGLLLVVIGIVLAVVYAVVTRGRLSVMTVGLVELLILLPPVVAGGLFMLSGRERSRQG